VWTLGELGGVGGKEFPKGVWSRKKIRKFDQEKVPVGGKSPGCGKILKKVNLMGGALSGELESQVEEKKKKVEKIRGGNSKKGSKKIGKKCIMLKGLVSLVPQKPWGAKLVGEGEKQYPPPVSGKGVKKGL